MKHYINPNKLMPLVLIVALLFITACNKELNVTSKDAVSQSSLTAQDIPQLRIGMYSQMQNTFYTLYNDWDVRGENFIAGPGHVLLDPVAATSSDGTVLSIWNNLYQGIYAANNVISVINNLGTSTSPTIRAYKGEALFFRAFLYYHLVTRWGNVPILTANTLDVVPQSKEADVWKQVKSDLTASRALVSTFSNDFYVSDQTVKSLMAKVYLATGDNANAALYADSVISSKKFTLATDSISYATAFGPASTSKEIIFALANSAATNAMYANCNNTTGSWNYSPVTALQSSLYGNATIPVTKKSDVRKTAVFTASNVLRVIKYPNGISGQQLLSTSVVTPSTALSDPIVLFRIAEMYLIKAEALGAATGAATLNSFLITRYKTAPTSALIAGLSTTDYQNLILDEYRREFYEEGQWWYVLKRTNRTDLLTTLNNRTYLLYYPIPQSQIDLGGYTQNPGY